MEMTTTERIPVSLILTTLNEANVIPLFLDGVRASTVQPDDIVICDGGSTDDTVNIIRQRSDGLPVTVLVEHGATIARGRNIAAAQARNDILAITDAGCRIEPDWLRRITEPLLADESIDAVGGGYALEGETRVQRWTAVSTLPMYKQNSANFLPSSRSFALRREALLRAGGYQEELSFAGEDTALCLRMRKMGMRFVTRFDALVHWETRPTLRAFIKQYYFYGLGDGEARSLSWRYRRIALKWFTALALIIASVFEVRLLLLPIAGLVLFFFHIQRAFDWKRYAVLDRLGGFLFVMLKEGVSFIGYIAGRLNFRKRNAR